MLAVLAQPLVRHSSRLLGTTFTKKAAFRRRAEKSLVFNRIKYKDQSMEEFRKPMSLDEYLTYPRKLGWKYEYFGDALHLSPAWTAIATFRLELDQQLPLHKQSTRVRKPNVEIRPIKQTDHGTLITLFCESFLGSIDYAGYDSDELRFYAHRSLDRVFGSEATGYLNACRVAVEEQRIVGGCLIGRGKVGPVLQPIFVVPSHQRHGIATELFLSAIDTLMKNSVTRIHSKCNLGNEASLAWHLQCGFTEIPNRWTAGHRANIYRQETERQELLQLSTAPAMRELANYWAKQRERLETEDSFESEEFI